MKKPPLTAGRAVSPGFAPTASPEGSARARSAEDARRAVFDFPPVDKEKAYDIIDAMKELGDARGVSVAQITLSWLLRQKHVTSVIIGAKTEAQLTDNLAVTSVELSSDDIKRLDEVSKLKPEYPGWMLDRQRGERAQNLS
jgi:aryl-alcohol dehydrogenase-like predicted oxidoreductase